VKEERKERGSRHEVAKRNWEVRCGTRRGMPWLFDMAMSWYRPASLGSARLSAMRRDATRCAAPHRAVVLLADIFIGGRATCNRLRGIRTERCFAHLYPRFAARPIQRQPSLSVLAPSRFPLPASSPSLSHFSFTSYSSLVALSVSGGRYQYPLKRLRVVLPDVEQRISHRDDILAVGYWPSQRSLHSLQYLLCVSMHSKNCGTK